MNFYMIVILGVLLTSKLFAGVGFNISNDNGKNFEYKKIAEATRGGVITVDSKDKIKNEIRLLCIAPEAKTLEECDKFHFAWIDFRDELPTVAFFLEHSRDKCKYNPEADIIFNAKDLEHKRDILRKLKSENKSYEHFKMRLGSLGRSIESLETIAFAPTLFLYGDHFPETIWPYIFLDSATIVLSAVISPVFFASGGIFSLVNVMKIKRYFNSIVKNKNKTTIKFGLKRVYDLRKTMVLGHYFCE